MKYIQLFLFLFYIPCSAQNEKFKISGKVVDAETQLPLSNVSIQVVSSIQGTITDSLGFFNLSHKEENLLLLFSSIGYEKKYVHIKKKSEHLLVIPLSKKSQELKEVTIKPKEDVEIVIKNDNSNIIDYAFYDDNILLITCVNNLAKSKLVLINQDRDTLAKIPIPEKPVKLFKDCLGNNQLICENNVYQINYNSTKLSLLPPKTIKEFESILYPCVAEDSLNFYFIQKYGSRTIKMTYFDVQTHNHILNYYYFNKTSKKKKNLVGVVDEKTLKTSRDEDRFANKKVEIGLYRNDAIMKDFDRMFAENIVFKEIYAPLFKIKDSIYIFDYINSKINQYSPSGKVIKSTKINFHTLKNWKREMYVDEKNSKAYAVFQNDGITELQKINLQDGTLQYSYKIPFPFVENIKVRDDYIYFLYHEHDYSATKFLSRIKVN